MNVDRRSRARQRRDLLDHLVERHRYTGSLRAPLAKLQQEHSTRHWRYHVDHGHGPTPNLGPGQRPDGWRTGLHVVEWT